MPITFKTVETPTAGGFNVFTSYMRPNVSIILQGGLIFKSQRKTQ
jgi:hypothetical protein